MGEVVLHPLQYDWKMASQGNDDITSLRACRVGKGNTTHATRNGVGGRGIGGTNNETIHVVEKEIWNNDSVLVGEGDIEI